MFSQVPYDDLQSRYTFGIEYDRKHRLDRVPLNAAEFDVMASMKNYYQVCMDITINLKSENTIHQHQLQVFVPFITVTVNIC